MDKPTSNNTKNKDDSCHPPTTYNSSKFHSFSSQNPSKKSLFPTFLCFPTSVFAVVLILLVAYNSFTIFSISETIITIENGKESSEKKLATSQPSSNPILEVQEELEHPLSLSTSIHFGPLQNSSYFSPQNKLNIPKSKRAPKTPRHNSFSKKVRQFFLENSCELRVFMTWISSLDSFKEREKFTIESLFKSHPNACLVIVSESMDSPMGITQVLRPFWSLNFKVIAVSPDYKFVFKNTMAAAWFDQLEKGNIKPGEVSLGQNLSNLIRLALLYKYGGVYMDTDFIILKSLEKLRNSIGAQNIDQKTKSWSRLNNALMVFDKNHPLLNKFIEEFALTFNGNKWGHNGPYLVSRVVERVNGSKGDGGRFTILSPAAFYPVDWSRIGGLFQRPRDEVHLKWAKSKLKQIEGQSYAVHLWNRQSKGIIVEDGSIISHLMKGTCVVCNSSIIFW